MTSAVDFVLETMRQISASEPVLFARNGALYVVSPQGFGQVAYGAVDMKLAQDVRVDVDYGQETLDIITSELPYFKAIALRDHTFSFTLDDMVKVAQTLGKLPDNNKIRMIANGDSYVLSLDGMRVNLEHAAIMDREAYLDYLRRKEEKILTNLAQRERRLRSADAHFSAGLMNSIPRSIPRDLYDSEVLPDCVIMTPYLSVSLPRAGTLDRQESHFWTPQTPLKPQHNNSTTGSVLHQPHVDTYQESPFGVHVTFNTQRFHGVFPESLQSAGEDLVDRINQQRSAVASSMHLVLPLLDRLNALHNSMCQSDIESRKRLLEREIRV
ncbi:MAG: hypothetical protein Q8L34_04465 [Candidatus Woesearchaeota archaeon]|nr:hypothetical protein [Candidatus Woesearchaeota archaeon]